MTKELEPAPPVGRELSALGIPHRVFRHAGPVNSLEQAAAERGQHPDQVVRSILFRLEQEKYVMVLMAGPTQVSWRLLRQYLGQSRLTIASAEEVLMVTGYPTGAVSPFGLLRPLRVLIDDHVFAQEEVSIGSGIRGVAIILRTDDLRAALPAGEIGHFRS